MVPPLGVPCWPGCVVWPGSVMLTVLHCRRQFDVLEDPLFVLMLRVAVHRIVGVEVLPDHHTIAVNRRLVEHRILYVEPAPILQADDLEALSIDLRARGLVGFTRL